MTTEETLVAAHKSGVAYWRMNRPEDATEIQLAFHARSCGWFGEANAAWLAGFYGEKKRTLITEPWPYTEADYKRWEN